MILSKFQLTNLNKGFSLMELILVILLVSFVGQLCLKLNIATVKNKLAIDQELAQINTYQKLESCLEKIKNDYQKHPLNIKPVIHRGNHISTTDGKLITFNANVEPRIDSNAITYLDLNFDQLFLVYSKSNLYYDTCAKFANTKNLDSELKLFLGIGLSGYYELQIKSIQKTSQKPLCYRLQLSPQKSLVLSSIKIDQLQQIAFLVPINAVYTYYLDQEQNLRYLSTSGTVIRENQPIYGKIKDLKFSIDQNFLLLKAESESSKYPVHKNINFIKISDRNLIYNLYPKL
jgi:hypothetical protein